MIRQAQSPRAIGVQLMIIRALKDGAITDR
jgi:hypothetical protein